MENRSTINIKCNESQECNQLTQESKHKETTEQQAILRQGCYKTAQLKYTEHTWFYKYEEGNHQKNPLPFYNTGTTAILIDTALRKIGLHYWQLIVFIYNKWKEAYFIKSKVNHLLSWLALMLQPIATFSFPITTFIHVHTVSILQAANRQAPNVYRNLTVFAL